MTGQGHVRFKTTGNPLTKDGAPMQRRGKQEQKSQKRLGIEAQKRRRGG